jgi:antitoxin (DNA-binding transcriptional repressor) of toxin-antitoxin stability system
MSAATEPKVRTIAAGEFKARCLQLMDDVLANNLTLIVTKRGKPVIEATAPRQPANTFRPLWGRTPNIKVPETLKRPDDWADPGVKWRKANRAKTSK